MTVPGLRCELAEGLPSSLLREISAEVTAKADELDAQDVLSQAYQLIVQE